MSGRVFVFGSINTDLVVYVTRLPQPGETVSGKGWASFPGGKGANQAVAAARAGARVDLYGCLGDDLFGRERLKSLVKTGVSTRGVCVLPGAHSGIAQITVDNEGENTIAVAPGANAMFSADGIELPRPPQGETWVSLFQNEVPQDATEKLIHTTHDAGHLVLWNLAPTLSRRPADDTMSIVDFLICNRNELAALTEMSGAPETAARSLFSRGVRAVIVTLGREGSLLIRESRSSGWTHFRSTQWTPWARGIVSAACWRLHWRGVSKWERHCAGHPRQRPSRRPAAGRSRPCRPELKSKRFSEGRGREIEPGPRLIASIGRADRAAVQLDDFLCN